MASVPIIYVLYGTINITRMIVHLEYRPCIRTFNKNAIHGCCGSVYFLDSNCLEFRVSDELKQQKRPKMTLGVLPFLV